jgi:hypothetical protein
VTSRDSLLPSHTTAGAMLSGSCTSKPESGASSARQRPAQSARARRRRQRVGSDAVALQFSRLMRSKAGDPALGCRVRALRDGSVLRLRRWCDARTTGLSPLRSCASGPPRAARRRSACAGARAWWRPTHPPWR